VPSFVYVAADDAYVVGARAYADYCESSGVRCDYHEAPSGGHGFRIRDPLPDGVKDWPEKLRAFLREF
jgi:acetyl esterase/lipase